jgi:gp157
MARTLYDLGDAFNGVMDLVLDETMDLTVLEECLQSIEADIAVKCEKGIGLIRSLENLRDGMKAEATRLTDRQKIIDNRIRSIKDWYQRNLDAMGKSKVETMRGTMAVQNNTPALKITDEDNIPLCYLDLIPARYEVNKDAVKNALKAGEEVPGAHLEQGRSLRIR